MYVHDYTYPHNGAKEYNLSRGLAYLRQVVTAADYDEMHKLLDPHESSDYCFLFVGLSTQDERDIPELSYENYRTSDGKNISFFGEENIGPVEAWKWAHANSTSVEFYFCEDQYRLRQTGYVMWDFIRISKWDCFQSPWEATMDEDDD